MENIELNNLLLFLKKELEVLYEKGEAESIAYILLEHVLGYKKLDLVLKNNEIISQEKIDIILKQLDRLKKHEPIQHIVGRTEFYGLNININDKVLIPRQETEELVDWIIKDLKNKTSRKNGHYRIMDIGTGSGCIAIVLKKNFPDSEILGIDFSEHALETARNNSILNDVNVVLRKKNALFISEFLELPSFDIIVSNPPYIPFSEKEFMKPNVLNYEPHTALFVSDENPLIFYERLADMAQLRLKDSGCLYFEINENYGSEVLNLLYAKGFSKVILRKDLNNKDRMIKAEK